MCEAKGVHICLRERELCICCENTAILLIETLNKGNIWVVRVKFGKNLGYIWVQCYSGKNRDNTGCVLKSRNYSRWGKVASTKRETLSQRKSMLSTLLGKS